MAFNFFARKTLGGYTLGEVISALQKEIRRGNESAAMYWAIEIESVERKYLWNRLKVIVSEDIGLASTETNIMVGMLGDWYNDAYARKVSPPRRRPGRARVWTPGHR